MRYGSAGRLGIGTPQANPTVEAEFGILLPRTASLVVTRLTSSARDPLQRLREYLLELPRYLRAYDALKPAAFGFACTGSSYLLGAGPEQQIVATASAEFGYPVETAARAIVWGLQRVRATRIALVAPYPQALVDAGIRYWNAAGIEVVRALRIPTATEDTRGIYALDGAALIGALATLPHDDVDAILVSGTGLPSLDAIRTFPGPTPVLSSNACLAARLLDIAGDRSLLETGLPFIRGWQHRLVEALPAPP